MNEATSLQPSRFPELLDGTFRLYKRHFLPLWLFCFIISCIPTLVIEWWYLQTLKANASATTALIESELIITLVESIIWAVFLHPLAQNAAIYLSQSKKISWKKAFRASFRNFGKIFMANGSICLIWGVILLIIVSTVGLPIYLTAQSSGTEDPDSLIETVYTICLLLFTIPWIFLSIKFSLVIPIIHIENPSIWQAIKRSWELTRQAVWVAFGILLCLILAIIPISMLAILAQELPYMFGIQFIWLWDGIYLIVNLLINATVLPIWPLFFALLYWNQRARREAFDIQSKLQQLSS